MDGSLQNYLVISTDFSLTCQREPNGESVSPVCSIRTILSTLSCRQQLPTRCPTRPLFGTATENANNAALVQLCLGVHNLHEEKKVLHRDIKPNNVFLMDSKKIVQLGDFGLAKVINDGDKQVKAEVSDGIQSLRTTLPWLCSGRRVCSIYQQLS